MNMIPTLNPCCFKCGFLSNLLKKSVSYTNSSNVWKMVACSLVIFFFSLMTLINIHAILIILTFEDMSLSADQDFFFPEC